ncbi:hypothetical protein [Plastoroseomonas hellenica]|uniref:hypothetical protein n=1 Tax=Plastoroseomonas hellenica TaxID=2687306 RepID=UPI001BAAEE2E|nr:hypothetical protein [Plastoroseomonas hellenica]MBR0646088.1 hypothetical protein [Plastoroseomonas hellenica]
MQPWLPAKVHRPAGRLWLGQAGDVTMMKTNEEGVVIGALLEIVAKVENSPKIVSPFGFRIIEWNGERVLTPLSADEYKTIMMSAGKAIDIRKFRPDPAGWGCVATNVGCEVVSGTEGGGYCTVFHRNRIIGISCECIGLPDADAGRTTA